MSTLNTMLWQYYPENPNRRYIGKSNGAYCYDTNNHKIYYYDKKIDGLDSDTFEFISEKFVKDEHSVYWCGIKMIWADPKSFLDRGDGYSQDMNSIYYCSEMVVWADPKSFSVLTDDYAKDAHSVFWTGEKIEWADPKTFEILEHLASMFDDSYTFSRDAYHVYFKNEIMDFEDEDFDTWLKEHDKK